MNKIVDIILSNMILWFPFICSLVFIIACFDFRNFLKKFIGLFIVFEPPLTEEERILKEMGVSKNKATSTPYVPNEYKQNYNTFNSSTSSCRGCGSNLRVNGRCGHCGC